MLLSKINNRAGWWTCFAALAVISGPLMLARLAFAGVLTFASLLFVGIAQCFDHSTEEKLLQKMDEKLQLKDVKVEHVE